LTAPDSHHDAIIRDVDALKCGRCGNPRDQADNFCRRCGHQLTVNLPAVRPRNLPIRVQSLPPSLVGSVAVLAVGTGLEWLARRLVGNASRAAGRALIGRDNSPATTRPAKPTSPDVSVNEVLYVRKVELRR
jgi:hypothetical protein